MTPARMLTIASLVFAFSASGPEEWKLLPVARFGSTDGSDGELGDVRGLAVTKSGNVLVLDYRSQQLKIYAPDGRLARIVGRRGSGPGEFSGANGITIARDGSIWVNNANGNRYSIYREDGAFVRDVPAYRVTVGYVWDGKFDATGRLMNSIVVVNPRNPMQRDFKLQRINPVTGRGDSVGLPLCQGPSGASKTTKNHWTFVKPGGRGGGTMAIPFQPRSLWAIGRTGQAWCAFGSEYSLFRIDLRSGDTTQVVRGKSTPSRVASADRDSAIARAVEFGKVSGNGDFNPDDVPDVHPVLHALILDDDEQLWVRLSPTSSSLWTFHVFDSHGRQIATAGVNGRFSEVVPPVIRGAEAYFLTLNDDDIPQVVRFRIKR